MGYDNSLLEAYIKITCAGIKLGKIMAWYGRHFIK